MSFGILSNELVAAIFGELQSTKDLYSVSFCSRRTHQLVKPFLYATFSMGRTRQATSLFLRTLLETPQLRTYIKRLKLQAVDANRPSNHDVSFLSSENCERLYESLPEQDLGVQFCMAWQSELLSTHNWDAVSGVLLLLCSPNLEEAEMEGGSSSAIYIRELLCLAAQSQRNGLGHAYFTKLRRFSITLNHSGGGLPLLSCALQIKSILEFHIISFVDNNLTRENLTYVPSWDLELTATTLSMLMCQIDSELLRTFLSRFHSLKSFEYRHLKDFYWTSNRHLCMVPEKVKNGLSPSKSSLEKLTLLNEAGPWPDFDALEYPIQPIGPLTDFEKLRIIVMDAELLIGKPDFYSNNISQNDFDDDEESGLEGGAEDADIGSEERHNALLEPYSDERRSYSQEQRSNFLSCFPASLEHLTIRNCTSVIFDCISDFFLKAPGPPPKLKTLKLVFDEKEMVELWDSPGLNWERIALEHGVALTRTTGPDLHV